MVFRDTEACYLGQRDLLRLETQKSTSRAHGASLVPLLVELVRDAALVAGRTEITPETLLRKLGVHQDELFPAPPEMEHVENALPRYQLDKVCEWVADGTDRFLIHATGGVGKSVFALQLSTNLDANGAAVLYDCFGGGNYRHPSKPRHLHGRGLVQIANELAARGLCCTWVPNGHMRPDQYLMEFRTRLEDSVSALKIMDPGASLTVIIDAADNAEGVAEGGHSFAFDLLQEPAPEGVKLVVLCRTERRDLLSPSSSVQQRELSPFTESESLEFLRQEHSKASPADGLEFHRLTQGNPRLQSIALSSKLPLGEMLADLGVNSHKVVHRD